MTGDINSKGLIEVPMGITLRKIIYEIGGGIPGGRSFKMAQTGGTSGGCLPGEMLDVPMDYFTLPEMGSALGSGALLIMDDSHCIVDIAESFMRFFVRESCGKCVRAGKEQQDYTILLRRSQSATERMKILES